MGYVNLGMGQPPILRGAGQYQSPQQVALMSQLAQQAAPMQLPQGPSWLQRNRGMLGQLGLGLLGSGLRQPGPQGGAFSPQAMGLLGLLQRRS